MEWNVDIGQNLDIWYLNASDSLAGCLTAFHNYDVVFIAEIQREVSLV